MASTAKQPIDNELPNNGSAAENDAKNNVKITNISGDAGAKVEGGKITLNLKGSNTTDKAANDNIEVAQPKPSRVKPNNDSLAPTAANDNQEEPPHTEKVPPVRGSENSNHRTGHHDQPTPEKTPQLSNTNEGEPNQTNNIPTINVGEPTRPSAEEQLPTTVTQDNAHPDQAIPDDHVDSPDAQDQHPASSKTEQLPANADKQPPTVNQSPQTTNDALSQTGPHVSPNTTKTPATLPTNSQIGTASTVASNKANKGIGGKIEDGIQHSAKNIKEAPGKMIGKIKKNIASSLESDRSRVKKLKKERKKYGIELSALEGDVAGMKSNPAMLILKTLARPIYTKLTSLTFGKANATDSAKIIKLEAALLALNTIKATLYAIIAAVDYIESLVNIAKFGAALTEIIIGFFIIALSPFMSIPFFIFKFGAGTGKFSGAIRKVIKDIINPFIEKINELLKTLKKKVDLRKQIIKINQLLSATKQERKEHEQQQRQQQQQTANDNTENSNKNSPPQDNLQQAA